MMDNGNSEVTRQYGELKVYVTYGKDRPTDLFLDFIKSVFEMRSCREAALTEE